MNAAIWLIVAGLTALTLVAQQIAGDVGHGYWWDRTPGFWAAFAFLGTLVITVLAKALGKALLRGEDYYDR